MANCNVCGVELVSSEEVEGICYSCKNKSEGERQAIIDRRENPEPAKPIEKSKTIIKTYTGKKEVAASLFEADAKKMAQEGYYPVSQSFEPGTWGCGAFLIAVLACFILVGILALIYMLIVKPAGTLTVTYEYRGEQPADDIAPESDEKVCPQCAETVKAAAKICRYCRYEFKE